jgi:hypothetical protein
MVLLRRELFTFLKQKMCNETTYSNKFPLFTIQTLLKNIFRNYLLAKFSYFDPNS